MRGPNFTWQLVQIWYSRERVENLPWEEPQINHTRPLFDPSIGLSLMSACLISQSPAPGMRNGRDSGGEGDTRNYPDVTSKELTLK